MFKSVATASLVSIFGFVSYGLVETCHAAGPELAPLHWSYIAHLQASADAQPEGVKVTIEDGHAIVDFAERASESSVTPQLVTPFGPDVETPADNWMVANDNMKYLKQCLDWCTANIGFDDIPTLEDCYDECWLFWYNPGSK